MKSRNLFLVLCFSLLLIAAGGNAQMRRPWHNLQWEGSNVIYEQTRTDLRKQLAIQSNREKWADGFKLEADQKPNSELAQFKYAYALYITTPTKTAETQKIGKALASMQRLKPPYTREYCRLMFMIEFYHFPSRSLVSVGRRLAKELPNDVDIAWQLAVLLSDEPDIKSKRDAFELTAKVVKARPKDIGLRFTHAMRGYWVYFKSKSKDDARLALAAFQGYLRLAPNNKSQKGYREAAKSYVLELEYALKH